MIMKGMKRDISESSESRGRPKKYKSGQEAEPRTFFISKSILKKLEETKKKIRKNHPNEKGLISRSSIINAVLEHYCNTEHAGYLVDKHKSTINSGKVQIIATVIPKAFKKLEKAAERLLHTNDHITEIAFDCGFRDLAGFSNAFKAKYLTSPSNYRNQHQ